VTAGDKYSGLVRGTAFFLSGSLIAQFLLAITGLSIARSFGANDYGKYAASFALAGAFAYAFSMGIDAVVPREIARETWPASVTYMSYILPAILWGIVLSVFLISLGSLLGYSSDVMRLFVLVTPIVAVRSLSGLARSALRGIERMDLDAVIQVFSAFLVLICVGITIHMVSTITSVTMAMLFADVISMLICLIVAWRLTGSSFAFDGQILKSLMGKALPLGITFAIIGFNWRFDTIILSLFRSEGEVGLYSAAFGVVTFLGAASLVSGALLPRLSRLDAANDAGFQILWEIGLRYILIIGLGITVIACFFAPDLLNMLYGPDYSGAVPIMKILGLTLVFLFVNRFLWHALIAKGRQNSVLVSALFSSATMILFSFVLVPEFGGSGSGFVAIIRDVSLTLVLLLFAAKEDLPLPSPKLIVSVMIAAVLMFISLQLLGAQRGYLYALVVLPCSLVVYVGVLIFLGSIKSEELMAIYSSLRLRSRHSLPN
jgi:O-antigen/teichoic acid export membrane protein